MGANRFRFVSGAVLAVIAATAAVPSHAGTVSAPPEAAGETPIDFEQTSPTQPLDVSIDAQPEAGDTAWTTVPSRGDHTDLLMLGDYQPAEPAAWSPGFADGSPSGSAPRSGPEGYVFAPAPEQVLIPLPSAAWTGFLGLATLGAFGMMKHARRFFR